MNYDIRIRETLDGGDGILLGNDLQMVDQLSNQAYFALFGGNLEESTPIDRESDERVQRFDFWGNELFHPDEPDFQFNSEFERALRDVALTTDGLQQLQQIAESSLEYLSAFGEVTVDIFLENVNRIHLRVRIRLLEEFGDLTTELLDLDIVEDRDPLPAPFNNEQLLANWVRINDQVIDVNGVEERPIRQLHVVDLSDTSGSISIPGPSTEQSTDFDRNSRFTIIALMKSNEGATTSIVNNRLSSGTLRGIDLFQTGGGVLRLNLWDTQQTPAALIGRNQAGSYTSILGLPAPTVALNNNEWQWVAATYDGSGDASGIELYRNEFLASGAETNTGTFTTCQSGQDWVLGGRPGVVSNPNVRFSRLFYYSEVKTHEEIIRIITGELDTANLLRYYGFEAELGDKIFNHYVVNPLVPNNGAISGPTPNNLRVLDGVTSLANRYGYTIDANNEIIPVNLNNFQEDTTGSTAQFTGKVIYPANVISSSPFTWQPNPNNVAELNRLGITTATVITENSNAVFGYSELKNPLFRNNENTQWIAFSYELRHINEVGTTLDNFGPVLNEIGKETHLGLFLGQSNELGSNNPANGGDFVDPTYRDPAIGGYIANNSSGIVLQTVTQFQVYDVEINGNGAQVGPEASFIHDVIDGGTEVYVLKYAIGSTSLPPSSLNYWHPTERGNTGTPLWPFMIGGLTDAVNLLESTGRRVRIFLHWDQGESNRSDAVADYQQDLEDIDSALLAAFVQQWSRIFILRRGHNEYFTDAGFPNVPQAQDNFAAQRPETRFAYNSDAFGVWDVDDIHLTIPGQEDSGQRAAEVFLQILAGQVPA